MNALFAQMFDSETDNNFTQMSFNCGQKLFSEQAVAAMVKEYKQMEDMSVLMVIDPGALTKKQKQKALRAVNLIRDYEPSFGGKAYCQQLFNVRHTKYHEKNKTSLQGITVNALFAQMVDSETDNNFTQMSFNLGKNMFGERAVAVMVK